MTDMENNDTEEQKKSGYAMLREKHAQEMAELQAQLDAERKGRLSDKKLYFENSMKSRGYEGDFSAFADKYSSLDINDMMSLYEGQNGKPAPKTDTTTTQSESIGAKSVIAGANPTTEVGTKTLDDMTPEEMIKYAKTQSWYN